MFNKNHNGTEIIKTATGNYGIEYLLTRKTTKNGNIRHAVIATDGTKHIKMGSFLGIAPAFAMWKNLVENV